MFCNNEIFYYSNYQRSKSQSLKIRESNALRKAPENLRTEQNI